VRGVRYRVPDPENVGAAVQGVMDREPGKAIHQQQAIYSMNWTFTGLEIIATPTAIAESFPSSSPLRLGGQQFEHFHSVQAVRELSSSHPARVAECFFRASLN
jgi:hypothetical protein